MSNTEKLKEKPTIVKIIISIKEDYEKKGWESVRDRIYNLIIEIGKSPDNPIKVIIGYLEKEGNSYRNNQIYLVSLMMTRYKIYYLGNWKLNFLSMYYILFIPRHCI